MSDLISRQAVLDGIEELKKSPWATDTRGTGFEYLIAESLDTVRDLVVKPIPTAENKGEWHDDGFCGDYVCSVCNQEFDSDIVNMRGFDFDLPKFCPNCGARMKGSAI